MKKLLVLCVVFALVLSLFGCATSNQATTNANTTTAGENDSSLTIDWSKLPASWNDPNTEQPPRTGEEVMPQTKAKPIKVGWCPPGMVSYYQIALNGVKEAIEQVGGDDVVQLLVQAPADQASGAAEQVNIVEGWVEQGVDAIAVCALDDATLKPVFELASAKNIPVFEFNMPLELTVNPYYVSNIGNSPYAAGYALGEWAIKHYQGKQVNYSVIEGVPGVHTTLRETGFMDAVKDASNFKNIANQPADWDQTKAAQVAENLLTAHPEINMFYCLYDGMAMGVIPIIRARNLQGKVDVIGYDMVKEGLDEIKNGGIMVASVYTGCKEMGRNTVYAIKAYVMDGLMVPKLINSPPTVWDKTNADEFDMKEFN